MISKFKRTGFLYSLGIITNRIIPPWLFRFRQFVMLEMDIRKLEQYEATDGAADEAANGAKATARSVMPVDISWAQSEDIPAVESLAYVDVNAVGPDVKIVQAKSDGQLAGALWSVRNYFLESEIGVAIELSPQQTWLFAAIVDKQFRGKRIYPRLLKHMCCQDPSADQTTNKTSLQFLLSVNPHNRQSWKVHERFAKQELGEVFSLKILGVAVCVCFGEKINASAMFTWDSKNRPILIRTKGL